MKRQLRAFEQTFESVAELAVHFGVGAAALSRRLRNGESPEAAVNALLPIIVHGQPFKTLKSVADFYKVPRATLRHRVKKLGMSYEDAISLPVKALETGPVVVAGREYKSFATAAKAHGKDPESARQRLKSGMTAEEAILTPNKRNRTISHLGQSYESVTEFCDYFGINRSTAYSRLRLGWDLDDVINKPALYGVKIEYNGNSYSSISALCAELKLPYKLIHKRLRVFGWSIKDAVEKPKNVGRGISVGKKAFKSLKAAAKHYGVPAGLLQWRLSTGWPIEKAVDPNAEVSNRKPIEIDGEYFSDMSSAARAYGLNPMTFMARINRSGWTVEQAAGLEEPPANEKGPVPVAPENYIKRLKEVHGDNLDFSNAKFGKAQGKVEVRCMGSVKHANFWATPNNLLRGKGCPICKISHGARKIARFLDNHEIPYEVEWTGHGLRSLEYERAVLRMDFHLLDRKTVIEFDGIQHFEPQTLGKMTEEQARKAFEQVQVNDNRKNEWALRNGYQMIRIRYNEPVTKRLAKELL